MWISTAQTTQEKQSGIKVYSGYYDNTYGPLERDGEFVDVDVGIKTANSIELITGKRIFKNLLYSK